MLLSIQNNSSLLESFLHQLNEAAMAITKKREMQGKAGPVPASKDMAGAEQMKSFLIIIEEFQQYVVTAINTPFKVIIGYLYKHSPVFSHSLAFFAV